MSVVKERIPVEALCCPPVTAGVLEEAEAAELAAALKALADPVRLRLVSLIAAAPTGEICACDLPALLDRSQPTVSHHLTQLVRAGLLSREQRGKWAWFRIRPDGFAAIRAALGEGSAASDVPAAATS
jgi:ArsR family transcriptional regulator